MPNTLGHFGIQGIVSRAAFRNIDVRWILLGCVLPDVAWIIYRITRALAPAGTDPYFLRLYGASQATLLVSTILAGACAVMAPRARAVFGVLALNALLHLLLDACQTKWGNGIHLFAPLSWRMEGFELFWPESWISHLLTLTGVGFIAWSWRRGLWAPLPLAWRRWPIALLLFAVYLVLPIWMQSGAYDADTYGARSLRENRVGASIGFDREQVKKGEIHPWNERTYTLIGKSTEDAKTTSLRGVLVAPTTYRVDAVHDHGAFNRDWPSLAGLILLVSSMLTGIVLAWRKP